MHLPPPASASARALARTMGLCVTTAALLERRGYRDEMSAFKYLHPKLSHLTRPDEMADREAAAGRIARAVTDRERVVIFGDYDCDGITAAAILTEALRALGGDATPLLASRFGGGYGLSEPALDRVLEKKPSLLITCDCGSADAPRVRRAKKAGVDVIVIDHHLIPPEPLEAVAFLNPHRDECGFPYKGLASCGLAMSVAAAVRAKLGVALDVRRFLDLVAIGTVADVAPLDGDNRALVRAGLDAIRAGHRPGLRALAEMAKLDTSKPLTARDIAFVIAPRLNATGRLGDPDDSLRLLLARDAAEGKRIAAICEEANKKRRTIQDAIVEESYEQIGQQANRPALVLGKQGWHHGVVGIVAGRVASEHRRPVIVAAIDAQGIATGSVRTSGGIDIHAALGRCRDVLLGFGGHAKAAGVTFEAKRLGELGEAFARACAELTPPEAEPQPDAEARLEPEDDPRLVVNDLARLEPCGEANPIPLLCIQGARLRNAKEVRGGHLKADVEFGSRQMSFFGPNQASRIPAIGNRTVNLIGHLRRDTYRGGDAVEFSSENISLVG